MVSKLFDPRHNGPRLLSTIGYIRGLPPCIPNLKNYMAMIEVWNMQFSYVRSAMLHEDKASHTIL